MFGIRFGMRFSVTPSDIRFEAQQTSQVGTEVHGGAGVTGAIEVNLHLTTPHGKPHEWRFVTTV